MIVIDTSVFVALVTEEPDAERFVAPMRRAERRAVSAGNYLECAMIAETRLGGRYPLDRWLRLEAVEVMAVDEAVAQIAADAFARFGKGRHGASLNFGDCFAYALAKSLGAPLLFKGGDFALTDIRPALT